MSIFADLFAVIEKRKTASPDTSYVASLFNEGIHKINAKIEEEAKEVIESANQKDKKQLVYEICDLLFHLFVLCGFKEVKLEDIQLELSRRFGLSGLEEKSKRKQADKREKI